jgi:hypothetical protein
VVRTFSTAAGWPVGPTDRGYEDSSAVVGRAVAAAAGVGTTIFSEDVDRASCELVEVDQDTMNGALKPAADDETGELTLAVGTTIALEVGLAGEGKVRTNGKGEVPGMAEIINVGVDVETTLKGTTGARVKSSESASARARICSGSKSSGCD